MKPTLHHSRPAGRCLFPSFLLGCLAVFCAAGLLFGETLPPVVNAERLVKNARVLYESIVRKPDGDYILYQRIEPPPPVLSAPAPVAPAVVSPEALAELQASLKPTQNVMMTAQVYEGSLTELCWMHEGKKCVAWSSVDFRLLGAGTDVLSADGEKRFSFFALTQVTTPSQHAARLAQWQAGVAAQPSSVTNATWPAPVWPVFPPATVASVPPGMTAWFALVYFEGTPEEEDAACAPLEALHAYIETHRAELEIKRAEREAQIAAEAARKAAEPKGPKTTVIQFWKEVQP
jgi:hypothetical protein